MKQSIQALSITLVCIMMICGVSIAGESKGNHRGRGMEKGKGLGMFKGLNLTDEQKTGVSNILSKYQENIKNKRTILSGAREEMAAAISADEFNETNIRKAFQKVASAREELIVIRAKIFSEVKPLLTAEQLASLKERKAKRMERVKAPMDSSPPVFENELEDEE